MFWASPQDYTDEIMQETNETVSNKAILLSPSDLNTILENSAGVTDRSGENQPEPAVNPNKKKLLRTELSYAEMIAIAIKNMPGEKATLREIYEYFKTRIPSYANPAIKTSME